LLFPLRGLGFLDGGEHRNLVDHAAVLTMLAAMTTLLRVFQFVVVRAMHVKTMS
jgi:hypothetical protein